MDDQEKITFLKGTEVKSRWLPLIEAAVYLAKRAVLTTWRQDSTPKNNRWELKHCQADARKSMQTPLTQISSPGCGCHARKPNPYFNNNINNNNNNIFEKDYQMAAKANVKAFLWRIGKNIRKIK